MNKYNMNTTLEQFVGASIVQQTQSHSTPICGRTQQSLVADGENILEVSHK